MTSLCRTRHVVGPLLVAMTLWPAEKLILSNGPALAASPLDCLHTTCRYPLPDAGQFPDTLYGVRSCDLHRSCPAPRTVPQEVPAAIVAFIVLAPQKTPSTFWDVSKVADSVSHPSARPVYWMRTVVPHPSEPPPSHSALSRAQSWRVRTPSEPAL